MVGGVRSGRRYKIGLFPVAILLSLVKLLLIAAWSVVTALLVIGLIFVSLVEFLLVAVLPVTLLIVAWPVIILPVTLLNTIVPVILLVILPVVLVVILTRLLEFPFLFMLTSVSVVDLSCLEGSVIMDYWLRLSRLFLHVWLPLKMILEVGKLAELAVDCSVSRNLVSAITHGRALGFSVVWPRSEGRGRRRRQRCSEQRLPCGWRRPCRWGRWRPCGWRRRRPCGWRGWRSSGWGRRRPSGWGRRGRWRLSCRRWCGSLRRRDRL